MKKTELKEGAQIQFEVLGPGWIAGTVRDGGVEAIVDRSLPQMKGWWSFDILLALRTWPELEEVELRGHKPETTPTKKGD